MIAAVTIPMTAVPAHDRPRERLLRSGADGLTDAELVALHLGTGVAGMSAIDLASTLLMTWGGVPGLARALPTELARTAGVGPAKAARIAAAFGLGARAVATKPQPRLADSTSIAREGRRALSGATTEQVAVLIADGGLRLLRTEIVAVGGVTSCPVPVREVLAAVLRHDGVAFGIAHNHPGGDATPSSADRQATVTLRSAAQATGLRFLDHVVVTPDDWRSAA